MIATHITTESPLAERLAVAQHALANINAVLFKPTARCDSRTRTARWDRYLELSGKVEELLRERDASQEVKS